MRESSSSLHLRYLSATEYKSEWRESRGPLYEVSQRERRREERVIVTYRGESAYRQSPLYVCFMPSRERGRCVR